MNESSDTIGVRPDLPVPGNAGASHPRSTRDSVADVWGPRTPHAGPWPVRVDERTTGEPERWVQSVCVLCSTGCGMDVAVAGNQIVGVRGRATDRVNHGRLGPKGMHAWEANASADRLARPLLRRNGRLEEVSWDTAMTAIRDRSSRDLQEYGPGSHGFYNSGQLFLEEYYTLALVAEAGVGTAHVDGNTRLCTATAALALIESFGTDGAPGSYADFDVTDALFLVGHNMASTQTVLWARVLDRLEGPRPPKLVVVDPRQTVAARRADVHLAPRPGTNLALLNGLLRIVIHEGWIDSDFIRDHTIDFETLVTHTDPWTPEATERVTGVRVAQLEAAAEILGTAPTLVSTCLQGVYQSLQATASAVQVNNLHIIRGLIGKPGATVFQMNGQPTAQNTRECGVNGEFIAFRNWQNPQHVADTARVWNVEPKTLPTWTPPTHAMQMFSFAESGSIRFLWILGTNPAVSLPEVSRIRKILKSEDLFVVVSDAFLTETAQLADVVLPAALWGEKTGCTTNADRTVHLSDKAIDPPGEARSDLEALVDYARRMGFKDKDGQPLVKWTDAEGAFTSWREMSRGRPCDYSAMTYEKLRGPSGIQWPCTDSAPDGTERQYTDGVFNTAADYCEVYGHDLATGAAITATEYAANDPKGRAIIKGAEYLPPPEEPDDEYPLLLTTGRVTHHFHTRTKTGRSPALVAAAPAAFVELNRADAERLGIEEGGLVEVRSRRGKVEVPARLTGIEPGVAFMPFHYGDDMDDGPPTAANRLTLSGWDAVSKQPHFKYAAIAVKAVRSGTANEHEPRVAALAGSGVTARESSRAATGAGTTTAVRRR
jgi:anaerobic selenocysteine-containing dehydrogenase